MKKERCKETVWNNFNNYQCSRNAWKDGFCKQHHPDSVKERERKTDERWKQKQANSPWTRLKEAREEIEELKDEINRLNIIIKRK